MENLEKSWNFKMEKILVMEKTYYHKSFRKVMEIC